MLFNKGTSQTDNRQVNSSVKHNRISSESENCFGENVSIAPSAKPVRPENLPLYGTTVRGGVSARKIVAVSDTIFIKQE